MNLTTTLAPKAVGKTAVEIDKDLLILLIIISLVSAFVINLVFSIAYIVIVEYKQKRNSLIRFISYIVYILKSKIVFILLIISLIGLLVAAFCIKLYDTVYPGQHFQYPYYYAPSNLYAGVIILFAGIGILIFVLMLVILIRINIILYNCIYKNNKNNDSGYESGSISSCV